MTRFYYSGLVLCLLFVWIGTVWCQDSLNVEKGYNLLEQGKFNLAADVFRDMVGKNPEDVDAWNGFAQAMDRAGNPPAALDAYQKSLKLNKSQPETWFLMGNLLYYGKNYAEAQAAYRNAVIYDPYHDRAINNLGNIYKQVGQKD